MKPGKIIRAEREKLGINQKQLAERAKVPRSTMCRIEQDIHASVTTDTMKKIANSLGVSVDYLLGLKPKMSLLEAISADHRLQFIIHSYLNVNGTNKNRIVEFVNYIYSDEHKQLNSNILNQFLSELVTKPVVDQPSSRSKTKKNK